MKSVQWYYLSIVNTVYLSLFIFKKDFLSKVKNPITLSFLSLFIVSIFSVIFAINKVESLVKLTDLFTILSTLFLSFYIIKSQLVSLKFLFIIFLGSLLADVIGVLYLYLQVIDITQYNFELTDDIRAYYGNRNITSLAIAFKIPIVISLIKYFKKFYFKAFIILISSLAFYALLLLSSRAIILSTTLTIFVIMILLLFKRFRYKKNIISDFKYFLFYLIPLIIAVISFRFSVDQSDKVSLNNRVSSIIVNENDRSATERLRFYSGALSQIRATPLFGCGIGNWRILSIKYDSENMYSYIVPYFAHNDFLEIFAETGIFGFISYLLFFWYVFKLNFNNIMSWIKSNSNFESVLLFIPFIFYFIDSNLNFPLDRTVIQIKFIGYISLLFIYTNSKILNE